MRRATLSYSILLIALLTASSSSQWRTITAAEYDPAVDSAMSKANTTFPSVVTSRAERFENGKSVFVSFQVNEWQTESLQRVTFTRTAGGTTTHRYETITGPRSFYCSNDGVTWAGSLFDCWLPDFLVISSIRVPRTAEFSVRIYSAGGKLTHMYRKYAVYPSSAGAEEFEETLAAIDSDGSLARLARTGGTLHPRQVTSNTTQTWLPNAKFAPVLPPKGVQPPQITIIE